MTDTLSTASGTYPRGFSEERPPIWPMVRADSIVELRYGRALTESARHPGAIPVYGTNGRTGWHDEALASGPGVVLGRKGMGNLGIEWCAMPFWVIDTAYYAQARTDQLDLRYFYHLISYIGLNHLKDGTSNPSLSRDTFGAQLLPLPPLDEQRVIGATLSEFDDKIEQNRRTGAKLEGLARGVFKAWFVDFEPVKAKAAGETAFPGMPPETFAALPTRLTDSPLGPVPQGWEVKPLPEVIDFLEGPGIRNWQYTNSDAGTRFINIRCIKDRELDISTANRVADLEAYGKYKHFLLEPDDIVVSTSGTLGRFALVTKDDLPLMLNTSVIRMRPIAPFTTLPYLLEYIGSREFQLELETRASGSVQKNFGPMHLRQISVVVPSPQILKAHESQVATMLDLGKSLRAESRRLATLRDYLLPRLLSGRVRLGSQ